MLFLPEAHHIPSKIYVKQTPHLKSESKKHCLIPSFTTEKKNWGKLSGQSRERSSLSLLI
jgi:hypothetical protein